jgi:Zn-dependent oligopeptidase
MRIITFLALLWTAQVLAGELKTIHDFQAAATKANIALNIPDLKQTPEEITASMHAAIETANATLDQIGAQQSEKMTFRSTIVALENTRAQTATAANRAAFLTEIASDPVMRAAADKAVKVFRDWNVGIEYREDVYKVVKAFANTRPNLSGEDEKLFNETLRDYRRAGMELPSHKRAKIKEMRRDLSTLAADFETNIETAKAPVVFTKVELGGVPENFFSSPGIQISNDSFQVMADVMWQYNTVEENARNEATRNKLYIAHDSLAKEANVPLVNQILMIRNKIARDLGYKSWADYQAEVRMAHTSANAQRYIDNLVAGIRSKAEAELRFLQQMKAADTNDPNARINTWDWRYYTNQLNKQKLSVDKEDLRAFFPLQQTLDGMFAIFGRVLGLRFSEIKAPFKWTKDLRLYVISDASSATPIGALYLDLFPREGKTGGGGESEIVSGMRLSDGKYQGPVAAIVLNLPPSNCGKPSLLTHSDVEILFHEFGHALHCILTRAKYSRFAGTHVPVDFVEAPSQMLQSWVWDKQVLDTFAADYRDPSQKIPGEIIQRINEARFATAGLFYRRQFAFALLDLALHGPHPTDQPYDCLAISNPILEQIFLRIDPRTSFISSFRGFDGYDAGYYGYAWADAIAADMATVFEKAKDCYLDKRAGRRLRREIYEPGDSRDVSVSIEKFLGRKQSTGPFLKKLGISRER